MFNRSGATIMGRLGEWAAGVEKSSMLPQAR